MIKNPKHLQTVWFIKNGNVVKGCYTGTVDEPNIWDTTTTTKKARIGVNGESIYHAVNLNELFENETEAQTALKKTKQRNNQQFQKRNQNTKRPNAIPTECILRFKCLRTKCQNGIYGTRKRT